MRGNPFIGASFLLSGLKLITSPGLKRFILVPVIVNFFVFITLISLCAVKIWVLFNSLTEGFPVWAIYFLGWILWVAFTIASILITATLFIFITNFIASPFYGMLAEKTEFVIKKHKDPKEGTIRDILLIAPRAIFRELRKLAHFFPWLLLSFILFIFPLTMPLAPFAWFFVMSWIIAIQFIDYTPDNHNKKFSAVLKTIKTQPLTMLGFGAVISLTITIPILNLIIPPAAVAGGCSLWLYLQE